MTSKIKLKVRYYDQNQKSFWDIIVNGESLFDKLDLDTNHVIGMLGSYVPGPWESKLVDQYLGKVKPDEVDDKRLQIYGCSCCGDIGCGALTMELEIKEKTVVWKNFGWDNGYEETDFEELKNITPIEFDKNNYMETFNSYKTTLHNT